MTEPRPLERDLPIDPADPADLGYTFAHDWRWDWSARRPLGQRLPPIMVVPLPKRPTIADIGNGS